MMINTILTECNKRWNSHTCGSCFDCSYGTFCPRSCEKCLDAIHNPSHAQAGAPNRKYDCTHMADFYTCKYSCRYTSEIVYALQRFQDLARVDELKVLSFGCGPCTDLFAIDYLQSKGKMSFNSLEYHGIDYSMDVWKNIHHDIKKFETDSRKISFFYQDACDVIHDIANGTWIPNLIVFQYVFSDMKKHTDPFKITEFINEFARYFNEKILPNTYIILNDINLGIDYGGGREYFDRLSAKLSNTIVRRGRFCDDNARSPFYPRGYTYGENSDGEFPQNRNLFALTPWREYSPFDTCASAQMLIKKKVSP